MGLSQDSDFPKGRIWATHIRYVLKCTKTPGDRGHTLYGLGTSGFHWDLFFPKFYTLATPALKRGLQKTRVPFNLLFTKGGFCPRYYASMGFNPSGETYWSTKHLGACQAL